MEASWPSNRRNRLILAAVLTCLNAGLFLCSDIWVVCGRARASLPTAPDVKDFSAPALQRLESAVRAEHPLQRGRPSTPLEEGIFSSASKIAAAATPTATKLRRGNLRASQPFERQDALPSSTSVLPSRGTISSPARVVFPTVTTYRLKSPSEILEEIALAKRRMLREAADHLRNFLLDPESGEPNGPTLLRMLR